MTETLYLHGLNLLPAFGPARLLSLKSHFGSFAAAYQASAQALAASGLDAELVSAFIQHRETVDFQHEQERLRQEGIFLLPYTDRNYPKLLLEIPKFPPLLYYKGTMEEPDEVAIAVVGTRKITTYGRTVTPELVKPIAASGATIISGLAYGVDALAHETAVTAGRRTIAVLGGGIDEKSLYPQNHVLLSERIIETGGALVSEHPIGTPSLKHHFISRNRIISGMSVATLVVECDLKSGSLITAKHALDQNRSVYAVPGPIYASESRGPNNLIKMGAKLVTEAGDIMEDLNLTSFPTEQENQSLFGDTAEEVRLLGILNHEPLGINEIIKKSSLDAGTVTSTLTFLEMKGKVRNLGGQQYALSR